jgi:translation elongation factor EF-Tu-like GTPase
MYNESREHFLLSRFVGVVMVLVVVAVVVVAAGAVVVVVDVEVDVIGMNGVCGFLGWLSGGR